MPAPETEILFPNFLPARAPAVGLVPNQYSPEQAGPNFYPEYISSVEYFREEGNLALPVAGKNTDGSDACVIVQEHSPIEYAVIFWLAQRAGAVPKCPSPNLNDPNFVLLKRTLSNPTPVVTGNGLAYLVTLSGTYLYVLRTPGARVRDFPGLASPVAKATPLQTKVPQTAFSQSLTF